jgi:hypothetical protein
MTCSPGPQVDIEIAVGSEETGVRPVRQLKLPLKLEFFPDHTVNLQLSKVVVVTNINTNFNTARGDSLGCHDKSFKLSESGIHQSATIRW